MTLNSIDKNGFDLKLELARCLRCGFCYDLSWLGQYSMCPVVDICGFQSYGAKGKVILSNALIEHKLDWDKKIAERLYACVDCGSCELNCAMALPLKDIFHAMRVDAIKNGYSLGPHRVLSHNIKDTGNIYGIDSEDRALIAPKNPAADAQAKTIYFMGCVSTYLRREISSSTMNILEKAGISFNVLDEEICCGYPLWQEGREKEAKLVIRKNIEQLKKKGAKRLIFSCPSCYRMFKTIIPKLIGADAPFSLVHTVEVFDELLSKGKISVKSKPGRQLKVAYHDPCELGRQLGIYNAPRSILQKINGLQLIEFTRSRQWSFCCGGAGKFMMPNIKDFNEQISMKRLKELENERIDLVVSACPSCKSNLILGSEKLGSSIPVKDISELLYENLF
ncbi:MAG: (Fe-S)-binding protein [Candidatus Ranarchaeia archaeon]